MLTTTHSLALRPGEPRGLLVRELSKREASLTVELTWCGQPLGQHTLPLDGPPVAVPVAGGQLEVALLLVFDRPHLRVRFEGIDVPGSQFHLGTHQRLALLRGLAALGATVVAGAAAAWHHETSWALLLAGAALGLVALLRWIRRGERAAVVGALALAASATVGSFFLLEWGEFDAIVMLTGLSAYDLLFVFSDRMWMDEIRRRG